MIYARLDILNDEVLKNCKDRGIEAYTLKKSMANCIAFSSNNRKRREFELTFLKDDNFKVSTRFTGYKLVMMNEKGRYYEDNDPDGRRKRFNAKLNSEAAVNELILKMLELGFSKEPVIQFC